MKLEQQSNSGNFSELDVLTQKSGEWETLSWDFSSLGATVFDKLVFMFDLGNTGDGTATSTFYFDDVQQVATLGIEEFNSDAIKIFPNPATSSLHIKSNSINLIKVEIFSLIGNKVKELDATNLNTIYVDDLSNGLYLIKVHSTQGSMVKKFIKK